jgi:HEAT repeat protein
LAPAATITETVNQAFQDIQSQDSELRRGGIMLLAKYPSHPGVIDALCDSLDDPDTAVRRTAAVSIVTHVRLLNATQAIRLLNALPDPDKEVRLTIATWLPQIILTARSVSGSLSDLRTWVDEPVISALSDTEPLVRRKAVEGLSYLMGPIPPDQLLHLFADPNTQVRLTAYPILKRLLPKRTFTEAALAQFPDPDPSARLALAETAATSPAPEMKPLLQRFLEDSAPEIRMLAATGLFLIEPRSGLPPVLRDALESNTLDQALLQKIIHAIRAIGPTERKPILNLLEQSEITLIRAQAIGLRLGALKSPPPAETFETYLRDPAPEIRRQVLQVIQSRPHLVVPSVVMGLPDNPYLDVRQRVPSLLGFLNEDQQMQTLTKSLFDPEPSIRASSLQRIAQIQPANWQALFRASLRDPSPRVRQVAARTLLRALGHEGIEIAAAHSRANPDQHISLYIQQELARMKK